jgi:hypothetical protein
VLWYSFVNRVPNKPRSLIRILLANCMSVRLPIPDFIIRNRRYLNCFYKTQCEESENQFHLDGFWLRDIKRTNMAVGITSEVGVRLVLLHVALWSLCEESSKANETFIGSTLQEKIKEQHGDCPKHFSLITECCSHCFIFVGLVKDPAWIRQNTAPNL